MKRGSRCSGPTPTTRVQTMSALCRYGSAQGRHASLPLWHRRCGTAWNKASQFAHLASTTAAFATPADHFCSALTEGTRPHAILLSPSCSVCAQRVRMIGGCPVAQGTFGRYNDLFLVDTGAGGVDVIFNKRGVRAFAYFKM